METKAAVKVKKSGSGAKIFADLAPVIGLVLVLVIFSVLTKGALLSTQNIQSLSNQIIVTALTTIGAVFVFGSGFFDMSIGGSVCFAAVIGGIVAINTGSLVAAFFVILAISLGFGIAKGLFAANINVPFFIFTIVLGSVISSIVLVILGSQSTIYLDDAVTAIPALSFGAMTAVNLICLAGFFIVCLFLFNYTSIGVRVKNMGGNPVAAKQSGIDLKKTTMTVFIISAIGAAIAAFLILIRVRAVGGSTASGVGNDIMVALVLGGMPLSGGPRTKISAGILGAATITVLNSGLTIMGLSTGEIQIVRGIVFIVVVFVASFSYRDKLLPR